MRKDYVKTLFSRMLTTYLTVTIGILIVAGVTVGALLQGYLTREKKEMIARELIVISQLKDNAESGIVQKEAIENELLLIARHYDGLIEIVSEDGSVLRYGFGAKWNGFGQAAYSPDELQALMQVAPELGNELLYEKQRMQGGMRVLTGAVRTGPQDAPTGLVRFSVDLAELNGTLEMLYLEIALVVLFAILVGVIAVYYTTTQLTKPFLEMNDIVQRYGKGDLDVRIPIGNTEEATQLAVSFNAMADQLKDLEATRKSFVANVSHELRSPLTSMKGFLEAMQDGTISPNDFDKYIDIVLSETRRMAAMVNDLLDLARIESGKTAIKPEVFDINELIRRTLLTFEARIYEKSMEVEVKFAQEQYYVDADNTQIGQVLRNIIDNAIKYSPDHTKLRIATYAMQRKVYVSISDSGQGIPEEDVPHVFDRFYKVEKAHTVTQQSGTGLGLAIVKRIIDQHGETITVQSAKGKGSTFTFTLKRAASPRQQRQQDGGKKNG